MHFAVWFALPLAILGACKTNSNSDVKDAVLIFEAKDIPLITCSPQEGKRVLFSMVPQRGSITAQDIGLQVMQDKSPLGEKTLRLDLCFNESTNSVVLKQIVDNAFQFGTIQVIDVIKKGKVRGLDALMFSDQNSYGNVEIIAPFENTVTILPNNKRYSSPTADGLVIKGFKTAKGSVIAAYEVEFASNGSHAPKQFQAVLGGGFEEGDPIANPLCKGEGDLQSNTFVIGKATMKNLFCKMVGTSGTDAYRWIETRITDQSEKLPANRRGVEVVFKEAQLRPGIEYQSNHHNDGDNFVLKTPDAVYAVTCHLKTPENPPGIMLPGAPPIKTFKITYTASRAVETGATPDACFYSTVSDSGPSAGF